MRRPEEMPLAKPVEAKKGGWGLFGRKKAPEDVLNAWSANISKLLSLVDKASQQIQKEAMVHKVVLNA